MTEGLQCCPSGFGRWGSSSVPSDRWRLTPRSTTNWREKKTNKRLVRATVRLFNTSAQGAVALFSHFIRDCALQFGNVARLGEKSASAPASSPFLWMQLVRLRRRNPSNVLCALRLQLTHVQPPSAVQSVPEQRGDGEHTASLAQVCRVERDTDLPEHCSESCWV